MIRAQERNFMNFKKGLSAVALLLALTVVGCNGNKESAKPASSAAAATSKVASSAAATSKAASSATPSSTQAENPLWTPLARTYTEGTAAKNSADKDYIPLTDATANKVGVKIAIANWEAADFEGATATSKLATDGGIEPKNDHNAFIMFKIKAPKAGNYQMVMKGKCSSGDGEVKTLDERAFAVKVNGEDATIDGERNPMTTSHADFVAVPTLALRGPEQEDVIAVSCSDYRIKFDTASFVLFNEI